MLVLSRRSGERVKLMMDGEFLGWILVQDISGQKIKLGFDCHSGMTILREEVADSKAITEDGS